MSDIMVTVPSEGESALTIPEWVVVPVARIPGLSSTYVTAERPEKYGADNTGAMDSRLAIQAAIDAARDAGGGVVLLEGTYRVDAPLVPRSNVEIRGVGWGRSIIKPPASWASGSVIQAGASIGSPLLNVTIRDIKFDLSLVSSSVQAKAIFCTFMRNLRIENCWVYQSTATGIGADFLDASIIRGNRLDGCGRYAEGNEDARLGCSGIGIGTGAWGDEATLVEGNFVYDAVRYGIFVESQGGISTEFTRGIKIRDNHIRGAHWGIGSDGVAWAHITGNTIEQSDQDGIVIAPGNAGGKSWGDLVTGNTVINNGRHGLIIDMSSAGNGTPTDSGKYLISNNRFRGNTSCGIKIVTSSQETGYQIIGNRISANGSIGLDITGGGIKHSEILDNLIVDNTGIGIRALGNLDYCRIVNNRSGDTRSGGSRTQTYGIEITSTYTATNCLIQGNDLRNNATGALNVAGTLTTTRVEGNAGYNPIGTDTLSVTASPMTYTCGPTKEVLYVIGGTWTTVSLNSVNVATTAPNVIICEPYDVVVFTYTGAPTAIKRHRI